MGLICKRETTVWPDKTPNHDYVFETGNSKAVGYISSGVYRKFRVPIAIDERGRTFKKITVPAIVFEEHTDEKAVQ